MCVSTICPTTWLRLATSFQLRGSGGVKLGFEGPQSFSICKWNNSDNNFGQYQWKLRSPSFCTSTVHAIHAAEIPPLLSSIVRYQFRKYSAVRKGQVQDALEGSFHLVECLENPSKLRRSRTRFGVTVNKDLLQDTCLLEEHLLKATKPKNSKRKLDVINSNEEPIEKITKSKKTRRKLDVTDSNEGFYRMEFDGASKGNPGKAGAGVVLRNHDGSVICELKEGVGRATNNVAEYRAVILGLKVALSRGIKKIHVQGDSNLVCMQIQEKWKTKSQNIAELCEEAKELKSKFKEFRINHIYRELNGEADALANAAIYLNNGEIKNDMANYQLDNLHEMASSSQRKSCKKSLKASLPLDEPLEKLLESRRSISSDDLLDTKKDLFDTTSPSVECLTKTSKPRRTKSKVGVTEPNKEMIEVSSLLEEAVGKRSKSKETRRKLKVTDSNEEPIEKITKSKKTRRKLDVTDSNEVFYLMEFDGASKGNPGKAGAGAVLRNHDGSVICELKEGVGRATNNVAEYRAVILGLKVALSRGIKKIHVQGDSNLVCMQIQEKWKIKSQNIAELCEEAKELKSKFKEFRINHIYRELNGEADALANAAIYLNNGEIKNDMANYQLDNPHEMASSSQRKRSKKSLEASLPLEKPLEKLLESRITISSDDLLDIKKDLLDTVSPSVECLTKTSKPRRTKSKVGVIEPNKEMIEVSTLLEEAVGKRSKSKEMRRKLKVTDSNEVCELKENVGIATHNKAVYHAIILGLKDALSKGIQRIHVQGDSKLVYMQVQGFCAVKSKNIVVLHREAKKLISKFKEFCISHVDRELNCEAKDLANAAIELQSSE